VPIGARVRERRQELGLTQREAARELRVALATYRNWEAGRAEVSDAQYPKVVRFLGGDPNPAPRSLPERVRAARLARGLSPKALALRLGLDPSTVRAWEAGKGSAGQDRVRRLLEEFVADSPRGS
jgi:transcriptional regulator with XRE-family HTH domain